MSLSQAIAAAVSGLHVTQSGLALVASNVANAETPGYVKKSAGQVTIASDGISVRIASINRELDQYVQAQLRTETSGASYADLRSQMYDRLQGLYGTPGSDSALTTIFNDFTSKLQSLAATPDDPSARISVVSAAQVLAQQLNALSNGVQGLRSDAELGIADSVASANDAMQRIAQINNQIAASSKTDSARASLLDDRDTYVQKLAQLMDINVVKGDNDQVTVFTNSGVQLVGSQASTLKFDPQGTMSALSKWDADPTKRTVGTITLTSVNGGDIDLIANNSIRSGQIAAYLEMRDQILPQAQTQLDQIAAGLASALSDKTTSGTAVTSGSNSGFDIDVNGLLNGNSLSLTYTDALTNTQHKITFVRADDPNALPLPDSATNDPNDTVVGINFSAGVTSAMTQINAALHTTGVTVTNPAGTTLRFLNGGPGGQVTVNALSSTSSATTLQGGSAQLPMFTDGGTPYTGAFSISGSQSIGLASRINVNASLVSDPAKLVLYQAGVDSGDPTRPNFIYDQLTNASLSFSPDSGIGSTATPFNGSIASFLRQVISQQGEAADAAGKLKSGQDVVLNSIQSRYNESSSVNIDEEMSNLLKLQNNYSANARVLTAVRDMLDTLLKI